MCTVWGILRNIMILLSISFCLIIRLGEVNSVVVGRRVVDNISSGRKVFKLLKFVDEVKSIMGLLK